MEKVLSHIRKAERQGRVAVWEMTTGARFEASRGIHGYCAVWYGRGWCTIAWHTGMTLRECAALVAGWIEAN